jgi:predicted nucleic acid-binding protein
MIVVADTSPINYLVLIKEIDLLPTLFGHVLLPQGVFQELTHPKSPAEVIDWISRPNAWLEVRMVTTVASPQLMQLDAGEREAIQLALETGADALLMDETEGRQIAESLRLQVRGTLGILERAAKLNLIDFRAALARLDQTSFRISPSVREAFFRRNTSF